jgi:Subtilase family/Fervidolysin N-terminal prodomain/Putative Ig domain
VLALTALATILALAGGATRSVAAGPGTAPAVPGELIVGFERGASLSAQNAAVSAAGGTPEERYPEIRATLVEVAPSETEAAMKQLLADPRVRFAEPNHIVRTMATPDDPRFSELWGLNNTGQTGGTPDADIDAPEAWDLTTGSQDVVVGVTDTGVDFGHPDLTAQQWVNAEENCGSTDSAAVCAERTDGLDNDTNGYVDDWRGWDFANDDNDPADDHDHGTHVSGTIGAVGSNATGVTGVNWNVKVMALKFLDQTGSGTTADAISATLYAADNGARVSSNSWGGGPFDQALLDAIEYGASRGMLFVAAAGNDSRNNDTTPTYPGSYASEAIVSVAATDHNDALAFFSSYGAKSVDLGAPGVNILSTTRNGTYAAFQGTSMATPHVAGVAALLAARFPNASPYGLKALLLRSVDPVPALAGKTTTGGRLNAFSAVSCNTEPKVWLGSPSQGFVAGLGDVLPIAVLGASCASPAGVGNVSVTVNGVAVPLTAASPDRGLYTGSYTVGAEGSLSIMASVTLGGKTATQTVTGTAFLNYTCRDVPLEWVDVTPGTRLVGASGGDDVFSTLSIGFPVTYFGQTYTFAYVSSNGFLALGSNAGATAHLNGPLPSTATPNGMVAPFWDDLNPGAGGGVYVGLTGAAPNRTLHVEWHNVPHFTFSGSGAVTFEVSLKENGDVRFQYLDTDFGNPNWNAGASATAGIERPDGVIARQLSFNQPQLTNGRAVSCAYGALPPPPPPPVAISTTSLLGGTVGQSYSQTLAATGGTPPFSWTLDSGALPAGLTLNASTGAVTGTPTSSGTESFTVRVTDSLSQTDTQALSIEVAPSPPPPVTISTSSLPGGTVGQAYSEGLAASGGTPPFAWSLDAGALPAGLTLNPSTGAITGAPTTAGTEAFTARVSDSLGQTDARALSIEVAPPPQPAILTASLPGGNVGSAYGATLQASGGTPPYTWSLDPGPLPPGLTLDPATGAISGTPTTAGTFPFTAKVTDAVSQLATETLSITVAGPMEVTAGPNATTILAGSLRSGSASGLMADDNAYYEVNSTTSGQRTTDWYGTFTGVSNSLSNLRVSYTGKNSRSCTQVIFIWRWTTSSWVQLSSGSVGTTEISIANLAPSGTLADYVSGTTGDGDVRVRVRCRRSSQSFFASGDLLRISYVRPAGFATAVGSRLRASASG